MVSSYIELAREVSKTRADHESLLRKVTSLEAELVGKQQMTAAIQSEKVCDTTMVLRAVHSL